MLAAVDALPGPLTLYGHSFGGSVAVEAAVRSRNIDRLALYEGGPKPPNVRFIPDELIARLEEMIGAGRAEQAVVTFMLNGAGVAPEELAILRTHASWPARIAAAHTIPRELRAINDYTADMQRIRRITYPVLLIVGDKTDPPRKEMFVRLATAFTNARLAVLPGQRHAAHQTAPHLLAAALHDFVLDR